MTRQRLRDLASLASRKGRTRHGLFLVEGVRSAEAAVLARAPLAEVLVSPEAAASARVRALAERAERSGAAVHEVGAKDLARVGDARTSQGVVAVARSATAALPPEADRVLVLDGVQDPGNVGALVRTAAWFGVGAVVADRGSADFENPKAVRAAMGGLWDVALARVPDLGAALDGLRERGLAVWGADAHPETSRPLAAWRPGPRSALVMGSEAHGLSEAARQRLTGGVYIARGGRGGASGGAVGHGASGEAERARGVEALNVAVAAGVLMHAWADAGGAAA